MDRVSITMQPELVRAVESVIKGRRSFSGFMQEAAREKLERDSKRKRSAA